MRMNASCRHIIAVIGPIAQIQLGTMNVYVGQDTMVMDLFVEV